MIHPKKERPIEKEVEIDREPSQEYEEYVETERSHRDDDERTFGETYDEDFVEDFVEDDPGEYERG